MLGPSGVCMLCKGKQAWLQKSQVDQVLNALSLHPLEGGTIKNAIPQFIEPGCILLCLSSWF
jgi:hypothetical protein